MIESNGYFIYGAKLRLLYLPVNKHI